MPFQLPDTDLTGKIAGNTGKIPLQNMGISAGGISANPKYLNNPPTILFHNDSGCGLGMTFKDSGQSFNLPAGAWKPVPVMPGESEVDYTVKYILPNPPVSLLMMEYYAPGEPVPQSSTLGNSPVGIGGSVSTASNSLSNESASLGTKIIDIGTLTNADLFDVFNDHFLWKVQQSGVVHQVLAGNNAGNPLQLGQAGDISEVLGKLLIDQGLAITVTSQVGTGSTSGTATFYEALSGTSLKIVLGLYSNYQNGGASTINIVLPTAFTFGALLQSSDIAGISLLASSVAQNIQVITTLAAGGGTVTTQTSFNKHSIAGILSAFDTIQLSATNNAAHTGVLVIIGI